jgi:hypothetical protein
MRERRVIVIPAIPANTTVLQIPIMGLPDLPGIAPNAIQRPRGAEQCLHTRSSPFTTERMPGNGRTAATAIQIPATIPFFHA